METPKKGEQAEDQGIFSTAVTEETLEEARRKSALNRLFGSSTIFVTHGHKPPARPDLKADVVIRDKAFEHLSNGEEAMRQLQYEKAVKCFSKAMSLQPNEVRVYVNQAEAYLQLCDFQSALACYKQALLLQPGAFCHRLASIYHLQGQCLYDQSLYVEALDMFEKAANMKPGCRSHQLRRFACLKALGRYSDCLKLMAYCMESDSPTADLYTLRAQLHKQYNQMTLCYRDVMSALELSPEYPEAVALLAQLKKGSEQARQEAISKALSGQLTAALSKINTAMELCPENTGHYLFRGILYRHLKDFTASIEDLVLAVELSEKQAEPSGQTSDQAESRDTQEELKGLQEQAKVQLVLTYNDFAVHCFSKGFYPEATLLLNKAIEDEKEQCGLYINRGDCFFKQGEWAFALADYQQAEEMSPDDPTIWARLAVLHNTRGTHSYKEGRFQESADRFSLAIQYKPQASQGYENRAKAHHRACNLDRAKQDVISTLILDPTNEEVLPLLQCVFPGCSVADVLSSETGQAVKAQLTHSLQAHRLCRGLEKLALTQKADSQSEVSSGLEEDIKSCLRHQKLQKMKRRQLQVNQVLQLAFSHRPSLEYKGPRLGPLPSTGRTKEQKPSDSSPQKRPYH